MRPSLAEDSDFVILAKSKTAAVPRPRYPRLAVENDRQRENPVAGRVDLRPVLASRDAAAVLALARGQLNRAFRKHGLFPPDPLRTDNGAGIDFAVLDDPAAYGIERAQAQFGAAFTTWMSEMPLKLVNPVLEILKQTEASLRVHPDKENTATRAVRLAHDFLLGRLEAH